MKLGIFSDLHLHNFSAFATPRSGGVNSRAENTIDILYQIAKIAKKERLNAVAFCGDFFHAREHVSIPLIVKALDSMWNLADVVDVVMIRGNHDMATEEKDSADATSLFENIDGVYVLRDGGHYDIGSGVSIYGFGAGETLTTLDTPSPGSVLLLHTIVAGARFDNKYKVTGGIGEKELEEYLYANSIEKCFIGDIHLRQKLSDRIYYVGSCMQQSFREEGSNKGMLLYYTGTKKLVFRKLKSPRFLTVNADSKKINNYDFFKVRVSDPDAYRSLQTYDKPNNLQIIPVAGTAKVEVRSSVGLTKSDNENIDEYVDFVVDDPAKTKRLKKLGKELIK